MKTSNLLFLLLFLMVLTGCSKYAEDAADNQSFSATTINGNWRETRTGVTIRISGVSTTTMGRAQITQVGTAPAGTSGGTPLTEIEYIRGGYWEAFNNTYYGPGDWRQANVVGLAMGDHTGEFKIGAAVYKRQ